MRACWSSWRARRESAPADIAPVMGPPRADRGAPAELAEAGADEAILVVDPITERSIRALAEVVALVES